MTNSRNLVATSLFGLLAMALVGRSAPTQCSNFWLPGEGYLGPPSPGALAGLAPWDPDGPGPAPATVMAFGNFTAMGNAVARYLAAWDPTTASWSQIGDGTVRPTRSAFQLLNGDLVTTNVLTTGFEVVRWTGASWVGMGQFNDSYLLDFEPGSGGSLLVARWATTSTGPWTPPLFTGYLSRWNGSTWVTLATTSSGTTPSAFETVTELPNGDIVIGGSFTSINGAAIGGLARWNGTAWSALGPAPDGNVVDLVVLPNGNMIACGSFSTIGGVQANNIAQWNGTSWSAMGAGTNGPVSRVFLEPGGDLLVTGNFTASGSVSCSNILRHSGGAWFALGSGLFDPTFAFVRGAVRLTNGDWMVVGQFTTAGTATGNGLAAWNGSSWSTVGSGINGNVLAVAGAANGDMIVGGDFTHAGSIEARGVVRWDGTNWSTMGSGIERVEALVCRANGDIVAGEFGGVSRWDGASWVPLGSLLGSKHAFLELPNGQLIVGGQSGVHAWTGTNWSQLGTLPGTVYAMAKLPNGDVVAGGFFNAGASPSFLARWNGTTWLPFGDPGWTVFALATMPNGDLVAGGAFTTIGGVACDRIARWDGVSWSPLGAGFNYHVTALAVLADGDLVASGPYLGGLNRWDGASWSTPGPSGLNGVNTLAIMADGDVVAAGAGMMLVSGTSVIANVARLSTTCPATGSTVGVGCSGAGGLNRLDVLSLPWQGTTVRSRATGLPTSALAVEVLGLGTVNTPLSALLPPGGPACVLHATPDVLNTYSVNGGSLDLAMTLPTSTTIVGLPFYQQLVSFELMPSGAMSLVTASNALRLVVGRF